MFSNQQLDLGPTVLFPLACFVGLVTPSTSQLHYTIDFTYFWQHYLPVHILSCLSVQVPIPGFYISLRWPQHIEAVIFCLEWFTAPSKPLLVALNLQILWLLCHNILQLCLTSSPQWIQNLKQKQSIIIPGLSLQQEQFLQDTSLYKYFEHPCALFPNSEKFIFFLGLSLQEQRFLYLPFL
jgi:hypothetical protein